MDTNRGSLLMIDVVTLDERGLEDILSEPTEATRKALASLHGDIVVLGAGGKMGPTLAMMLRKASPHNKTIYAVSRFSNQAIKNRMQQAGIQTVEADLLDDTVYRHLPHTENIFYMVGMKFGATDNQPLTWALNSFVPTLVARHYKNARIVVFSTGNVYPLVAAGGGGAREETTPDPIGEYAQSCLGRERMFQYFSQVHNTPVTLVRLNYANEPRYGIIVDLTLKILADKPIDLTMGTVNLIWQRDANDYIIQAIALAKSPPAILNVTGPGAISIRQLAEQIGNQLGRKPKFVSQEADTALLSDASKCFSLFGYPKTTLNEMVSFIVKWVTSGRAVLNKPTKYDNRNGRF